MRQCPAFIRPPPHTGRLGVDQHAQSPCLVSLPQIGNVLRRAGSFPVGTLHERPFSAPWAAKVSRRREPAQRTHLRAARVEKRTPN